ncbi:uncharacterized protein [Asterias amurensis]|uniref:uncharacterized protein n=1 Tax=Asterias amurensis TaxID=7602 RepID=UPI003AB3CE2E
MADAGKNVACRCKFFTFYEQFIGRTFFKDSEIDVQPHQPMHPPRTHPRINQEALSPHHGRVKTNKWSKFKNQLRSGITTTSPKGPMSSMKQQQCQFASKANAPREIQAQLNEGLRWIC